MSIQSIQLIGLVLETTDARRFEIRIIRGRLLLVERAVGTTAFRSEPCPQDRQALDGWFWHCADEMAAVLGKSSDDTSDLLHDLLEQLSIPKDSSP